MKTAWKSEIKDFTVTGVTTERPKAAFKEDGPLIKLTFDAKAKGRLVSWNTIKGVAWCPVARIESDTFGPSQISGDDFSWVVHIMRNDGLVVRGMKPTPRKDAITTALTNLLAPALVEAAGPKKVKPAPATKEKPTTVVERPSGESPDDLLEIPEFLKRDKPEQPAEEGVAA